MSRLHNRKEYFACMDEAVSITINSGKNCFTEDFKSCKTLATSITESSSGTVRSSNCHLPHYIETSPQVSMDVSSEDLKINF